LGAGEHGYERVRLHEKEKVGALRVCHRQNRSGLVRSYQQGDIGHIDVRQYDLYPERMKFGIFLQPVHHPSEHPTLALERDFELLELLDRLGYDEAWIGEHHSTGWENIGSPEVFIAAAAQRTQRIVLGTGIIQLGLHHPLVVLDRMILLDHLTRGRVRFGVGVGGGLPSDLKVFGLSDEEAGRRLSEGMDVILRLLDEADPITEKTDWYELRDAVLQLKPYTRPHMPFAVASTNPKNLALMGRLGGQVLTGPIPEGVPKMFEEMEKGAAEVGRTVSRDQIMLSYPMHLASTREEAVEAFREGAITEQYDFNVAVNGRPRPSGDPVDWYPRWAENQIIGTPDDAIAKIEQALDRSGGFGGMLFTSRDWAGTSAVHRSWELFARYVAPHFQGHISQQLRASEVAGALNSKGPPTSSG